MTTRSTELSLCLLIYLRRRSLGDYNKCLGYKYGLMLGINSHSAYQCIIQHRNVLFKKIAKSSFFQLRWSTTITILFVQLSCYASAPIHFSLKLILNIQKAFSLQRLRIMYFICSYFCNHNAFYIVINLMLNALINCFFHFNRYIHEPAKDHYEHGHKRGNDHHFIERHEKGQPHAGEFKTKVISTSFSVDCYHSLTSNCSLFGVVSSI